MDIKHLLDQREIWYHTEQLQDPVGKAARELFAGNYDAPELEPYRTALISKVEVSD